MGIKVTFLRESDEAQAQDATTAQPVTLVPKASVVSGNGASYAFVVRGETVERRAIRTGGTDGDRLEVVAGLRAGERVVVSPPPALVDGSLVVEKGR